MTLIAILVCLIAFVLALPILLLFPLTAVPTWVALGLVAADVVIAIAVVRGVHTPLSISGGVIGIALVSVVGIWLSQHMASTPRITDADGNSLPNSIATLEPVELGGSTQWLTIRGHDVNNPVLLFLAGGPGGGELSWLRAYLPELEEHFVVVNWEQPGSGRSYDAVDISTLTPERFVSDAHELVLNLRERFETDKIYLLGESWGSILGVWLVQRNPEYFHAFISTGQMVYTTLDDVMGYEFALQLLDEAGATERAEALRENGPPPYTGTGMLWTYNAYLSVLNHYMDSHIPGGGLGMSKIMEVMRAPEYGLVDKVNWLRGLIDTFENVYPLISDLDFTTQAARLDVPAYFIVGRYDVNAMTSLVEEYFDALDAPSKEMIWFEESGHTPLYEEPARFVDVMVNRVMAETLPQD